MKNLYLLKITAIGIILLYSMNTSAVEVKKELSLDFEASGKLVYIRNLAGKANLMPSSDNKVHIRGIVTANVDNINSSESLLDSIVFETSKTKNQTIVSVKYPTNSYDGFIYRPIGNETSPIRFNQSFDYMGEKVSLASTFKKTPENWAEIHTDLIIELPQKQWNKINIISGDISSQNFEGESTILVDKGKVKISDSKGKLRLETNQGSITSKNHLGSLKANTGYGDIKILNINGEIQANSKLGNIITDKNSGDLEAITEFGSITINKFLNGEFINLSSYKKDIRLNGNLEGIKKLEIETEKGNVKIISTHSPSLKLNIEFSDEVNVDLPELEIKKNNPNKYLANIGSKKGKANIKAIDGNVNFSMMPELDLESEITKYAQLDKDQRLKELKIRNDSKLAAKVRIALSRHKHILDNKLKITASDGKIVASGDLEKSVILKML